MSQLLSPPSSLAPRARTDRGTVRVVSVPAGHPYVTSVTAAPGVRVLEDPRPDGAPAGQWWPPVVLDPDWIAAHAADADILHIHFGTESFSTERLRAVLRAARTAGWPVVFTVHDLEHPQLRDQELYRRQLDLLVPGADQLFTLTEGAAAEVLRRWGRTARVVAHPSILAGPAPRIRRARERGLRVGMHLKDLRSNIAAEPMVAALAGALDRLAADGIAATAEVRMHHSVRDESARDRVRELCAGSDRLTLVEHDRLDDDALAGVLSVLDACVLPYGYGTHSGWLELCWDLGVPMAVPAVGFYAEQHVDDSVVGFEADAAGESLASALGSLAAAPRATRAGSAQRRREVERRRRQREVDDLTVAAEHARLYRRLVAGR